MAPVRAIRSSKRHLYLVFYQEPVRRPPRPLELLEVLEVLGAPRPSRLLRLLKLSGPLI